jgi:ATP-dependent RNA helicase DHX36
VHSVAEGQRIALSRKLEAFRDDEAATEITFPANLDNTERKYLHTLCKGLGLTSKSTGKVRQ